MKIQMNKTKILYVDDESINLMLLKLNFRDKYDVITVDSAQKGLDFLASEEGKEISIVISDMKMPNMSGIEFIEHAKVEYTDIKYFILTGLEITPTIKTALDSGLILDYFRKPFNPAEIEEAIENALKSV